MSNRLIDQKPPHLTLKWGTVKGWNNIPEGECRDLLAKYLEDSPASCALDRPDNARKHLLCELIEKLNGTFYNDWDGKVMTKEEAKDYVMGYGR